MQEELYYWNIIYTLFIAGKADENQTYYSYETKRDEKGPCMYKTLLGYYTLKCKAPKRESISTDINLEQLLKQQVNDEAKRHMTKELKEENSERYSIRIFLGEGSEELVEE